MYFTSTIPVPRLRRNGSSPRATTDRVRAEAERIIKHFIRRGVIREESRAANHLRSIFAAPPEALRVNRIARRVYCNRATLARHFRAEGLPAPRDWITLARALYAQRTFLRGGTLHRAAYAAGYPETFTMSNAFRRITGVRPSQLCDVDQKGVLDLWIIRQRERRALTGPPPVPPRTCPICGRFRSS